MVVGMAQHYPAETETREVSCVWPVAAALGEGAVWSAADQALWFVDIKGQQILRYDPTTQVGRQWQAPDLVSFVLPEAGGGFVVGMPRQIAHFAPTTGVFTPIEILEGERDRNRLNDACVDASGRLWFGSMDDDEAERSGVLYCWHGAGRPVALDQDFVISNGPAHSPDGRTLYHTDTVRRTIYRFHVHDDASLSDKQVFIEIEAGAGWPDGTCVDSEGCLWVALWEGWSVRRYSPQGKLLEIVSIPCAKVTKLALGGADLKTAFVTTASIGLSADELAAQPLAGGLFTFNVGVSGLRSRPLEIGTQVSAITAN